MRFFIFGRSEGDKIQRDENGEPVTCDCPDGPDHPCDGTGWCQSRRDEEN